MSRLSTKSVEPIGAPAAPDAELVARALAGDRWAREAIYRRHAPALFATVARLMRSRDGVDDVVQDSFVQAFESLGGLRDPAALRPWLLGIAVHRLQRLFRRRTLMRLLGVGPADEEISLAGIAASSASPEVLAELALIDRALSALAARDRLAWMLRHVEGEELRDVAIVLGCSLATAKRRIAAAEQHLAGHLGTDGGSP